MSLIDIGKMINQNNHFTNITNTRWKSEEVVRNDKDFIRLPRQHMPRLRKASNHAGLSDYP